MVSSHKQHGHLLVLVLVFGAIFFMIISSFLNHVITQSMLSEARLEKGRALSIAEAGLDYYKWYLAHFPNDTTYGTTTPAPYVVPYQDPEAGLLGYFSLEIASSTACGEVYAIDITSTGYTAENPEITRTVYGRYARPTVSEFAYIINSSVWAGSDRVITGPYHSNGGIRMDGTNNSTVSSGQETWSCTSSYGCTPSQPTAPGVVGSGPNSDLWSYPSPPINFTSLLVDLNSMKTKAQTGGGIYIPSTSDYGYRVHFRPNGTIDVYEVDDTYNYWGYTTADGWQTERHAIQDDDFYATYTIPAACPVIFVEDKVWIHGQVNGKVSIAAANPTSGLDNPSMIIHDDITYTSATSGLLAIAEQDMLVGIMTPDDLEINGIYMAQTGRFGRNHYDTAFLSSTLDPYVTRSTLRVNGTIASNGREGTKWTSGAVFTSGYNNRFNSYDRNLVASPPPLTPYVSDTYEFIEWREVE